MIFPFLYHMSQALDIFPYGVIAIIVCPGVLWTIPISLALIYRAFRH